jgi:protein phosphatase
MGGHIFGEVASRIAVNAIREDLVLQFDYLKASPKKMMIGAIGRANREIARRVSRDPRLRGMGTTVTVGFVNGRNFHVANVGNTRAYLISKMGLRQLTEDHTFVHELLYAGLVDASRANTCWMRGILTQSLDGESRFQPHYARTRVRPTDYVLLCTDGLSDVMSASEIFAETQNGVPLKQVCRRLVGRAVRLGGTDDITVVVGKDETTSDLVSCGS